MSSDPKRPKRGDWVKTAESRMIGIITRVARDGSWADVRWCSGGAEWSKRMPCSALEVLHTIPFRFGTVRDMKREKELARKEGEGSEGV